jgi:hypothetical protein
VRQFVVVLIAVIGAVSVAHADNPAPPPTALVCHAQTDCPQGAVCSNGECVEAPASSGTPVTPPSTPVTRPEPPRTPSQSDADAARTHFLTGVALLTNANYAAALVELEESYRLRPLAGVLKNIAVAQQGLFRYSEAIASLEKYLADSVALTPEDRAEAAGLIIEMRALLAEIFIDVAPVGAMITVDRRPAGAAPLTRPLSLAAGLHSIEVAADGFQPDHREVSVVAGAAQRLSISLTQIQRTGKVRISASVPRAIVSIDDKPAGTAPLEVELESGGHTIELTAPGYKTQYSEVSVAAGQTRDLKITLDALPEPKPWFKKGQYITPIAVGVGVIAVGLTINYATTEDPVTGTLQPGVGVLR